MSENKFPSEVEIVKKLTNSDIVKETHISYAIIGDEFVYKIKKAVDFGFLNYKLAKSRRAYCILEKELNERFSKGIYLEVLKLVKDGAHSHKLVNVENTLPAVEYVLKMKRISDGDFLSSRIESGLIKPADIERIGSEVANLLKNLESAPKDEDFSSPSDAVKFNAEENFSQTEKYLDKIIDKTLFGFIKTQTLKFIDENKSMIDKRSEDGFVKNGHGDLRLEHIYFNSDGSVGLIDCIEFNRRFRYTDAISEAAFLSMELDYGGNLEFSDAFIKGFLQVFNDKNSLTLLNYYRCYLSYVRAKVACFSIDGKDENSEFYKTKLAEIKKLIDMSAFYAAVMNEMQNLVFFGLMGTGKTKNAKTFAERFPIYYIGSDEARKKAAGIDTATKVPEKWNEGIYSRENSLKLYDFLGEFVETKNKIGRSVIADASFSSKDYYDIFKKHSVSKLRQFIFEAPKEVIMQRLAVRKNKNIATDGRPELYEEQRQRAIFPTAEAKIDTTKSLSDNTNAIFKKIIA